MMHSDSLSLRLILWITWFTCCHHTLSAAPIDEAEATRRAQKFFTTRNHLKATHTPRLANRTQATYLFTQQDGTFVVTSADDRLPEILGYGTNAHQTIPPALTELLQNYDKFLKLSLRTRTHSPLITTRSVPPLLTTVRHQSSPYNGYCPYYTADDGTVSAERCVVGCVATALEQILTYHKRIYTLQDTLHGWHTEHYEIADILPGNTVDSRLIRDQYDTFTPDEADAVARLSYWLGMAAHMSWGINSSGATSRRCVGPLQKAFGLQYVFFADSYKFDPSAWIDMLRAELDAARPVYYAAHTMRLDGHAFVIDGYDTDGFFHVNWGYGGEYDGYFDIATLCTGEPVYDQTETAHEMGFCFAHEALFLHPDAVEANLPHMLERTGEEIVCESYSIDATPIQSIYTPLTITLHNTSDKSLTTPIELFTNLPTDTAFIQQGDYVALTGVTLQSGGRKTIRVHLRFDEAGERILRMTLDEKHYQTLGTVSIDEYQSSILNFANLSTTFPDETTAEFTLDISHSSGARSGRVISYRVTPVDINAADAIRHEHYVYLEPGETFRDTVRFRGLQHGVLYSFTARNQWHDVLSTSFRLPAPEGITGISASEMQTVRFMLNGQRVTECPRGNVYIQNHRKILQH